MFSWWPFSLFETLVLIMLFVMTSTLVNITKYFEDLRWIRTHLDILEQLGVKYLPKMFESQVKIEDDINASRGFTDQSLKLLESILVNTLPPKQRAQWNEDERIARGEHL